MVHNNLNITDIGTGLSQLITRLAALSPETLMTLSAPNDIEGTADDDELQGTLLSDLITGGDGNDTIDGFFANDLLTGGNGDDILTGNVGNDILEGGEGADIFRFDASRFGEGGDLIRSFEADDRLEFDLGSLLVTDPGLASSVSDNRELSLEALDDVDGFGVSSSQDGFVVIEHPNGEIEIEGLTFSADIDSFAELVDVVNITDNGPDGSQILTGEDDVEETITGGDGDDILFGGTGADTFSFNPNNAEEGHDVIGDFDPAEDTLAFDIANLLAADPSLAAAAQGGNNQQVELADLDASDSFFLFPTADNSVGIAHPNGSIELDGVRFNSDTSTFTDLADAIELQNVLEQPTAEQEAIDGFVEATTVEPGTQFTGPAATSPQETGFTGPAGTSPGADQAINGTGVNGTDVNGTGINGTGVNGTDVNGTGVNGTAGVPMVTRTDTALTDLETMTAANQNAGMI